MLKGHAVIELKNEQTGEVEVHEHDNMFTQSIYNSLNNKFIEACSGVSYLNSYNTPVQTKHLGGVVLFEDPIDEEETICNFPEENRVVGYAGTIASDGSNQWWGSRNLLETEAYDPATKTVKWVWDFTTSQGNGTISALGLSYGNKLDWYGDSLYSKEHTRYVTATSLFSKAGARIVEFEGNEIVYVTNGTGSVKVTKAYFNFDVVTLNNTLGELVVTEEITIQMPMAAANYYFCYWKDGDDGYWYGFQSCTDGNFSAVYPNTSTYTYELDRYGSQFLQIIRINKETYEVEHHNVTLPSSRYVHPTTCNPIITKYYIIMASGTTTSEYTARSSNQNYVRNNEAIFISKQDWAASAKTFVDEAGNSYTMYKNTYNSCFSCKIYSGQVQTLKLPNGTYMMNDLMLDDEGLVIKQTKPPINNAAGVPTTSTNANEAQKLSTLPNFYLYQNEANAEPLGLVLNKKANLLLSIQQSQGTANSVIHLLIPAFVQTLATINNLDTPVVKTSAQSMKVTYTVSEEVTD